MKQLFLFSLIEFYTVCLFAQKLSLDTSVINKWPLVGDEASISNDGKYVSYSIREHYNKPATLMIHAIKGNWKKELPNVDYATFTDDSRKAIFTQLKDSLWMLTPGSATPEYISQASSFNLFKHDKTEWLVYKTSLPEKTLVLRNMQTHKQQSFTGVTNYLLSQDGKTLVLKTGSGKEYNGPQSLHWIELPTGNTKLIWEGNNTSNLTLDATGRQLAFTVEEMMGNQPEKSIWYYKAGTSKAVLLVNDQSLGIDSDLQLDQISQFSKDGTRLVFTLKEKAPTMSPQAAKVDIWSYTDAKLQSQQLNDLEASKSYKAVINVDNNHHIIQLQHKNEEIWFPFNSKLDDYAFIPGWKTLLASPIGILRINYITT